MIAPDRGTVAGSWREWLARHFPDYTTAPMAPRHERVWDWFAALSPDRPHRPRIEIWPRGGAKSSTVELACAWLGAQSPPQRRYVLYISETQEQADKHVQSIAAMFERIGIDRAVNRYGSSRGWKRTEIRTATGFNVSAFGLDAGLRGVKLDQYRPDVMIFDDIDGRHDTAATTNKKIEVITESIIPAEAVNCAHIVVQNMIHKDSIVARLADGRADFLMDREPATVERAVEGLEYERTVEDDGTPGYRITAGTATWEGQSIAVCERQMTRWGIGAFLREAQHEVDVPEDGLWDQARDIEPWRVSHAPELYRIVIGVDPSGSATGDEVGIVAAGLSHTWDGHLAHHPHAYVLDDVSLRGSPKEWAEAAVRLYTDLNADAIVAEKNYGGEMVAHTLQSVPGAPAVRLVTATRGKLIRAEPVQKLYEDGRVHHVGTFAMLEKEMRSFTPDSKDSPNRMDACFIAGTRILTGRGNIPIEDVRVGDTAMTRQGWQRVTNWGMTSPRTDVITVELSDGRTLTGTRNHPVFTHNRGFVSLDALVCSDILELYEHQGDCTRWQAEKTWLSSTASGLFDTLTARQRPPAATSSHKMSGATGFPALGSCIKKFGKRSTVQSPPVTTSITAMETSSTTTPATWNVSQRPSTPHATLPSSTNNGFNTSTASVISPQSGTAVTRDGNGIESMGPRPGKSASLSSRLYARIAESALVRSSMLVVMSAIAVAVATERPLMRRTATPFRQRVRSVAARLPRTSTDPSPKRARVSVVRSYESGEAPVYNLSVAEHPEYFANGVLVHNCVWAMTDLMGSALGTVSDSSAFAPAEDDRHTLANRRRRLQR